MEFPTEDQMRAEFRRIKALVEEIEAGAKPLRDQYDKLSQDFHKKIGVLTDKLKEAEKPLFDLKNKMGTIVRALGNRTGG